MTDFPGIAHFPAIGIVVGGNPDTPEQHQFAANWCQGYRCGHIEGKDRCGAYVIGEETERAWEAATANRDGIERTAWAEGFAAGYRRGASGEAIPDRFANWSLPESGEP